MGTRLTVCRRSKWRASDPSRQIGCRSFLECWCPLDLGDIFENMVAYVLSRVSYACMQTTTADQSLRSRLYVCSSQRFHFVNDACPSFKLLVMLILNKTKANILSSLNRIRAVCAVRLITQTPSVSIILHLNNAHTGIHSCTHTDTYLSSGHTLII